MSNPAPTPRPPRSWHYRPGDDRLYFALGAYGIATLFLLQLSYGSISGYIFISLGVPLLALTILIGYQISARPRPSPLAFCLVLAGILAIACRVLLIAAEASAAV